MADTKTVQELREQYIAIAEGVVKELTDMRNLIDTRITEHLEQIDREKANLTRSTEIDYADNGSVGSYLAMAASARAEAQVARDEAARRRSRPANISDGFRKNELLDRARQLDARADQFERYAEQAQEMQG